MRRFSMRHFLTCLSLASAAVIVSGCSEDDSDDQEAGTGAFAGVKIASMSDVHYMDPSLLVSDGVAFQTYLAQDRKMLAESKAILDATVSKINASDVEIVLVTGDLTKDGERVSHEGVAAALARMEASGKKVYVVPGNHDMENADALSYDGDNASSVATVTYAEFKEIYADFGYGEAVEFAPDSMSYLAKPADGLWILGISSVHHNAEVGGSLSDAVVSWIGDKMEEAREAGALVVGMMHHGLTEHYTGQSTFFPDYVIEDWQSVADKVAGTGLQLMFTGHYHANDITKDSSIYDIETGSLVTYPCPIRRISIDTAWKVSIVTDSVKSIDYDLGGVSFPEFGLDYLQTGLSQIAPYMIAEMGITDSITVATMTPFAVLSMMAHYAGDESPDATTSGYISQISQANAAAGLLVGSLWQDLPPADNKVSFQLKKWSSTR